MEKKVAFITGSSKGIGASCAQRLARDGYIIAIHYCTNLSDAEDVKLSIESLGGKAEIFQCDLSKPENAEDLISSVLKKMGRLDLLVNNAGTAKLCDFGEITNSSIAETFNLNINSLLLLSQEAAKYLPKGGSIINISSINGHAPSTKAIVYSASKAAVNSITQSMSLALGRKGIRINSVAPGPVDTELLRSIMKKEDFSAVVQETPFGRIGEVDDIANIVSLLASSKAQWATGQIICASGGLVL